MIYHVINRGCGRMRLFGKPADYAAFEKVMLEAMQKRAVPLLSYCLMPNHWHFLVCPKQDDDLSTFMHWLTMTHTLRWRHLRQLVGLGPLYQGRFRAFAVETDEHYLKVCRYVERNALRAGLVDNAQDWRWCSLNIRQSTDDARHVMLHPWPVDEPADWIAHVNRAQTDAEVQAIRQRIRNGRPFGSPNWERRAAVRLGLEPVPGSPGRPRRQPNPT